MSDLMSAEKSYDTLPNFTGCISEDDVRSLSNEEKDVIDSLIDQSKPVEAGTLKFDNVHSLYRKGLIYIDVPVNESDKVEVPPLEGFIMNRVVGKYHSK